MKNFEAQYALLITHILDSGELRQTRNAKTKSVFGRNLVIDELEQDIFPILDGRRLYPSGVFGELAAFFNNAQTVEEFKAHGCNYWGQWADKDGKLNLDYGRAWRDFHGVDQLAELVKLMKHDPNGRRHIVTGWDPSRLHELSLPCCHMLYQWYVRGDGRVDMIWYQRSVDVMVGLPSDIMLAAAWLIILSDMLNLAPGCITMMMGDVHIYESHFDNAEEYLGQAQLCNGRDTHTMYDYTPVSQFENFTKDHIKLLNYNPMSPIKFEVHA